MTPETNSQKLPDRIVSLARRPWVKPVIEQGGWYKFIFLLFTFPCFHLSNFFFKLTYTLQQRELVRLGRELVQLDGQDLSLQFDNSLPNDRCVMDTYYRLSRILRRLEGSDGAVYHRISVLTEFAM